MARTFNLGGKQSLAMSAIRPAIVGVFSHASALFRTYTPQVVCIT